MVETVPLDWSGLPADEVSVMKEQLEIERRLHDVHSHKNAKGHTVINGAEVKGMYGVPCKPNDFYFRSVGRAKSWFLNVPSRAEYYVIGEATIDPGGRIVRNGVVDYNGEVVSTE